jgi:Fur family ferric uptake transcriptional regulator
MTAARQTRQRTAVSTLMDELTEFRSAQEVHDILKNRGDQVGLTTVYRSLQSLAATGDVDCLVTDEGETLYRRCGAQHHHHLVCRDCGATVEVSGPAVERWADAVAAEHGFSDVSHTLEMFGRCATCTSAR